MRKNVVDYHAVEKRILGKETQITIQTSIVGVKSLHKHQFMNRNIRHLCIDVSNIPFVKQSLVDYH